MNKEKNRLRMREYRKRKLAAAPPRETHPLWIWRQENFLGLEEAGRVLGVTGTAVRLWEQGINETPAWVLESIAPDMQEYLNGKIREMRATHKTKRLTNELYRWRIEHSASRAEMSFYLDRAPRTIKAWELGERNTPGWVMKRLEVIDENLRKTENR